MPKRNCHCHELSLKSYKHHSHRHELSLRSDEQRFRCDGCKMAGYGERYRCIKSCDYDLHKECMHLAPTRTLELFPGRTLRLHDRPPPAKCGRICNVCKQDVKGFVYHCKEAGIDVHPLCASLERKMRVDGVELELKEGAPGWCELCNERSLTKSEGEKVPGFSYASTCEEGCGFHVHCLMNMDPKSAAARPKVTVNRDSYKGVTLPEKRVLKYRGLCRGSSKLFGVMKLIFKVFLSMIIPDPTAIIASVLVEMLAS